MKYKKKLTFLQRKVWVQKDMQKGPLKETLQYVPHYPHWAWRNRTSD